MKCPWTPLDHTELPFLASSKRATGYGLYWGLELALLELYLTWKGAAELEVNPSAPAAGERYSQDHSVIIKLLWSFGLKPSKPQACCPFPARKGTSKHRGRRLAYDPGPRFKPDASAAH